MHKKNKNNNRHSYHISSDFWNRKWQGEKRDKRKWEGHVMKRSNPTSPHSLPASSVATFGCLGRLRRSFLVYGHADISFGEGKKKKKHMIHSSTLTWKGNICSEHGAIYWLSSEHRACAWDPLSDSVELIPAQGKENWPLWAHSPGT